MWRGLDHSFTRALQREGIQVQVGGTAKTVLFRRKRDSADSGDWVDVYTRQEDGFRTGNILSVGTDNYLLVLRDHRENGVYSRYNAVRCNQTISLCRREQSEEPDKYGRYEEYLVPYATTPAYMVTQLTGLNKTAIGNVTGGNVAVIMPAYPINADTPIQCKDFDDTSAWTQREYTLQSYDCTDISTDADGNIFGVMRLQIK